MTSPQKIYHQEISDDLKILFSPSIISDIRDVSNKKDEGARYRVLRELTNKIDNKIGGNNILDFICHRYTITDGNGKTHISHTGLYKVEYRDIYRPLQYAAGTSIAPYQHISGPRFSIEMSCNHVECVLKRCFSGKIKGLDHLPLGSIVFRAVRCRPSPLLDEKMEEVITNINSVFAIAKHDCSYESVPQEERGKKDPSTFNNLEAICTFFICRKIGLTLDPDMCSLSRVDEETKPA